MAIWHRNNKLLLWNFNSYCQLDKPLSYIAVIFFLCGISPSQAQTIGKVHWYYGYNGGMLFTPLGVSPAYGNIGVSGTPNTVVQDSYNGELLFYANAGVVTNRNHDTMPNGLLIGSSNVVSLAIPHLDDSLRYFVVHQRSTDSDSVYHSVVDMSLDAGLGDIDTTESYIPLRFPTYYGMCATSAKGINEGKSWLAMVDKSTRELLIYLVDQNGPHLASTFPSGLPFFTENWATNFNLEMKFSPRGNYLAIRNYFSSTFLNYDAILALYKFDSEHGIVSDSLQFQLPICWHLEFSSNENFLYYTSGFNLPADTIRINQLNISTFDHETIYNSRCSVAEVPGSNQNNPNEWRTLKLGPDHKIYVLTGQNKISVINSPNNICSLVNFVDTLYTSPPIAVPVAAFVNNLSTTSFPHIQYNNVCEGEPTLLWVDPRGAIDSVFWNFGDPASGANNTQWAKTAEHIFIGTPPFTVTAIVYHDTFYVDTFTTEVAVIYPQPQLPQFSDSAICLGEVVVLSAIQPLVYYNWQNGSDSSAVLADTSGLYVVTVSNRCDTLIDSTLITVYEPFDLNLPNDTSLCGFDSLAIDPALPLVSAFQWSDGIATQKRTLIPSSPYQFSQFKLSMSASNACVADSDSIIVSFYPQPLSDLAKDTFFCISTSYVVGPANQDSVNYLWSNGTTLNQIELDSTSTLSLKASNRCGVETDTITVSFYPEIDIDLGFDAKICPPGNVTLNARWPEAKYKWSSGQTDSVIFVSEAGLYSVTVSVPPCFAFDQIELTLENPCDTACKFFIANVITPNGDGINDQLTFSNTCGSTDFEVMIFNRWGQIVFTGKGLTAKWDGTSHGISVAEGTYYYTLSDKEISVRGSVSVFFE